MTDETTLDDFVGESGGDATAEEEVDESEADASDGTDPEPAAATYAWTPGSAACEECGAAVERRWDDEGRLVCEDCKNW